MDFTCKTDLENLIADLNLFINSGGSTVSLSDGSIIEPYQSLGSRESKDQGRLYSSSEQYEIGFLISYNDSLYLTIKRTIGNLPTNNEFFLKIEEKTEFAGDGFSAFISFNYLDGSIIKQRNIQSLSVLNVGEFEIIVNDGVGAGNKLIYSISNTSENLDLQNPDFTQAGYFLGSRCIYNDNNKITLKLSNNDFNPIINIGFLEV